MTSYHFNVVINKPGAFDDYLVAKFPFTDYINSTNTTADVFTTKTLSTAELATLTGLVSAYIDPTEYLTLASQFTDSSNTLPKNNTQLETIKTFIHPASFSNDGVFNTFKMVVKYTADNLVSFATDSTCTFTFQLFCETRQYLMKTIVYDVTPIINEWKNSGTTGPFVKYQSLMISDLRAAVTNYDTICSFKGYISNSSISYSLHTLQSLFYNIQ